MVVLDESRNGEKFHSNDKEDGSAETNVDRDNRVYANSDTNNVHFDKLQEKDVVETNPTIEQNVVPDGGWGWFIILGCFVIRMICGRY